MKESTLKRFLRLPDFDEHLELHRLDCFRATAAWITTSWSSASSANSRKSTCSRSALLTGADLIAAGYEPGPRFSEILSAVEDAQLEGRIRTAGEAMALVRSRFPQ